MKVAVETPVVRSGRVQQIEGLFDVPPSERSRVEWELPDELVAISGNEPHDSIEAQPWNVGLIVGPSGSGKSQIAQALWPDDYRPPGSAAEWPQDRAVVDAFDGGVKDTVELLTAVGFGSPPSWLRPYHVLSTGEQFRAGLARALAGDSSVAQSGPVIIDEFTSVVDRQVAKVGSHAVQKAIRRRGKQLVAITCHYDVIDWLQPDWLYRPDTGEFHRRHLQRHPQLRMEVRGVSREAWTAFRHHHYLSPELHVAAKCMGGFIGDECAAFVAYYRFPHPRAKDIMVAHRVVVLPDYQGLGLGARLTEYVGQMLHDQGDRLRITTAHPAFTNYMRRSPKWLAAKSPNKPSRSRKPKRLQKQHASSRKLVTKTFEYVPI